MGIWYITVTFDSKNAFLPSAAFSFRIGNPKTEILSVASDETPRLDQLSF